jgi:hypothetical protein
MHCATTEVAPRNGDDGAVALVNFVAGWLAFKGCQKFSVRLELFNSSTGKPTHSKQDGRHRPSYRPVPVPL